MEELKFSSEEKAIQYLSDFTGKRIKIAFNKISSFIDEDEDGKKINRKFADDLLKQIQVDMPEENVKFGGLSTVENDNLIYVKIVIELEPAEDMGGYRVGALNDVIYVFFDKDQKYNDFLTLKNDKFKIYYEITKNDKDNADSVLNPPKRKTKGSLEVSLNDSLDLVSNKLIDEYKKL